jgi:hypothetical protein
MPSDSMESTNRLLKVIIAVLIRGGERQMPIKQQIETLSTLGLRPVEIAEILGKTSTHINKELSGIRKQTKRGKSHGKES